MAHYQTLSALIQRVVLRLSQVPGIGVQTYAEDRIAEMIQHKFDVLFDEEFWQQFMNWQTVTVSATLGTPTVNLETQTIPIKRFEDIRTAMASLGSRGLPVLPSNTNPFLLTGTSARYIEPHDDGSGSIFRIWPLTTTDQIVIHFRSKPSNFVTSDTINFDPQALILGSVYDYLEDDGTNIGATDKFKNMFESRVRQLKLARAQMPFELDNRIDSSLTNWYPV